jgi:phosphate transport system protein
MTQHTDKHFEEELQNLKEAILKMGGIVEDMISRSMKALIERDSHIAEAVIHRDPEANKMEVAIDERCLRLLALHQPAASDLRFIAMGLRASKDMERMGDLAVNIAEQALELNKVPQLKPYKDLPLMGEKSRDMVKGALDAFVKRDVVLAKNICEMDDIIDDLNDKVFDELVGMMEKEPASVGRATRLILVARHLERIADHSTNVAEEVIFMVQGKDIRHRSHE